MLTAAAVIGAAGGQLVPHLPARMASSCQQALPATFASPCVSALLDRAYTIASRWPFPPFHLVMEDSPGTCDFYPDDPRVCCLIARKNAAIERHVREVPATR